ncbi:MAG: VOC family protein [Pseudomonadota bacterium]
MTIQGMNHFTVLAEDLDATVRFYSDVLGLKQGYRAPLGFPGAWFYASEPTGPDGQAVLHVVAGRPLPEPRAGVIDHMAFSAVGLAATIQRLEARTIKYIMRQQAGSGVWQVFFHDPNGARIELDFAASEKP